MDDLRILLSADINKGKSIGDINKTIKEIQKSGLLKELNLNVDIDKSFQKSIKDFTRAANQLNKIIEQQNKVVRTEQAVIEETNGVITTQIRKHLANGEVITETIKKIDKKNKSQQQEIKSTEQLTDRLNELANARKKADSFSLDRDGNLKSQTSRFGDDYSTLTQTTKPNGDVNYRIDENYNKRHQEEVKLQQAIERIEKQRIQNVDAAEYAAYQEKEKREKFLHNNRIQDQKRAYDLALIEDNKFNQKRLLNEQNFSRKQQESLNKLAVAQQKFGHHTKVAKDLKDVEANIKAVTIANKDWDSSFKNINTQITKSTAGFKAMRQESVGFIDGFSTAMVKFPIWMAATTAFYAPLRGLNVAVDTILEVDKQVTELKRVMDADTNFENMLSGSIELAKELGRSITEVNVALTGFARQGFDESQVLALTESATLAQNISELKADEAMDALTAAMVVFNIEAKDSISIVDQLNEIDNNFAVTSQNLAIGMQKSASAASTFGVSLSELLGDLTGIMQATRESGSVAGNSLKTIYSRLTTMQPAIDALADLGINIHDGNDQLKTATQILDEVAEAYKHVNEETKQNTAVALAGRYQLSRFLALVENRSIAHDATTKALNSEGSAMRENAAYMESYEARINLMKTAWQEFSLAMGDAIIGDTIIALTNVLASFAGVFSGVVNEIGLLPPVLGILGISMGLFSSKTKAASVNVLQLDGLIKKLGITSKAASTIIKGALATTGVGLAFIAVGTALEFAITKFANYTEQLKKTQAEQEKGIESLTKSPDKIAELTDEYQKLSNKTSLNAEEGDRLLTVQNELYKLLPSVAIAVDETGQAHLRNADYIALEVERYKELRKEKDEQAKRDREKNRDSLFSDISNIQRELEERRQYLEDTKLGLTMDYIDPQSIANIESQISELEYQLNVKYLNLETEGINKYVESVMNLSYSYDLLTDSDKRYLQQLASTEAKTIDASQSIKDQKKAYDDIETSILASGEAIANMRETLGSTASSLSAEEILNFSKDQIQAIENVKAGIKDNQTGLKEYSDALIKSGLSAEQANKMLVSLSGTVNNSFKFQVIDQAGVVLGEFANEAEAAEKGITLLDESIEFLEDGTVQYTAVQKSAAEVMEDYAKIIDSTISELSELNNIIYKVSQGESLNGTEVSKLIRAYPDLEKSIIKTADGYSIEESALELVRQAKLDLLKTTQLAEAGITTAVYDNLKARLNNYGMELEAIQSLADAKKALAAITATEAAKNILGGGIIGQINPWQLDLIKMTEQLNTIAGIRETFNTLYASSGFGVTPSKSSSGSKKTSSPKVDKDDPKLQDATDARINAINKKADAQARDNQITKDSIDTDQSLSVQIKKTNNLYNGQLEEIELLRSAIMKLRSEREQIQKNSKYSEAQMNSWIDANGNATESFIKLYNSMKTGSAQEELQALYDKYHKYTLAIRENRASIADLQDENKELLKSLQALREENTRNWIENKTEAYQKYQDAIIASQRAQMRYHEEGSDGWFKEQQKQIDTYKQWQETLSKDNDIYRARIKQSLSGREEDALTEQQLKDLEAQIKANSDAWWDYEQAIINANKAIKDQREQAANKIVENFKKMLQKQKELELKAIDERMRAEDERHKKVISHYDKELSAFRDIINAQLDALNRENDTEDYERELSKLLDEQAEVQSKINVIANDDSYEAKAKRKELHEQLREIQERIEERQRDRSRNLQRQALEDQLSDREKYIDNLKDLEDESHDKIKENLQAEKTLREEYWNSIIENEQYFSNLKQNLMSNDVAVVESTLGTIRSKYDTFFSYLQTQASSLGDMFKTINDNFKVDYDSIKMPTVPASSGNTGTGTSGNTSGNQSSPVSASATAWKEYLSNKQKAEAMGSNKGAEFDRLKARNDELRSMYGFIDGSYSQLSKSNAPIFSAETGGMTAAWGKQGKFALLHEKELVLNKSDTSNILKVVDVVRNITDSFKQLDFTKMFSAPNPVVAESGTTINHLSIEINGSQIKDGRTAADEIVGGLLKRGIKIGRG